MDHAYNDISHCIRKILKIPASIKFPVPVNYLLKKYSQTLVPSVQTQDRETSDRMSRPPCEHWSRYLLLPSLHRHLHPRRRRRSVRTRSSRPCSRASSQSAGRSGRSTAAHTVHVIASNTTAQVRRV